MQIPKLTTKLNPKSFMEFLTSEPVITALSVVVFTPIALKSVESIRQKSQFFRDHFTIAMLIGGFLIFILSSIAPSGIIRAMVVGVAAGVVVTGVAPFAESLINKVANK